MLSAPSNVAAVSARFEPDELEHARSLEMDEVVQLGIDESRHSSLAWVGYDEYEKHLAALAEIEQAAFAESAPGAPVERPPISPETVAAAAERIAAAEADAAPSDETEASVTEAETSESAPRTDAAARIVSDPAVLESALPIFREFLEAALTVGKSSEQPEDAPRDDRRVQSAKTGPPETAPTPAPEIQPNPPAPPPAAQAEIGAAANKESDPTSIIEVPVNLLGQPIAREGLELKPRRPNFKDYIRVSASFGNPLVEMRFGRDGKPAEAFIVESSGDGRVDHAISVSLYRWRAKGAALDELAPQETLSVRIRIILNPRARRR